MPGTLATRKKVSLAYTPDSRRRNRDEFFEGREEIVAFLKRKWEPDHRHGGDGPLPGLPAVVPEFSPSGPVRLRYR